MPADPRPLVVHVVHALAPGGTERTLVRLLRAWRRDRFRHAVITLRQAGPLTAQLPDDVACRALAFNGPARGAWWRLTQVLRRLRPAVVHARGAGCWSDAILASMFLPATGLALSYHGSQVPGCMPLSGRLAARLARRGGARFLAVSRHTRQILADRLAIPEEQVTIISNGVDTECFCPATPELRARRRADLGISAEAFVVACVGSFTPVKRHDLLLKAFSRLAADQSCRLLLAGDGPLRAHVEAQARALGLNQRIQFQGWHDDVVTVLQAADLYVCSSDSEGQSNALLEALACGIPAVSTDVGDHAALLEPTGAGRIVPAGDETSLASAMRDMARQHGTGRPGGLAARAVAQSLDFSAMAQRYEHFYQTILLNQPAAQMEPAMFGAPFAIVR